MRCLSLAIVALLAAPAAADDDHLAKLAEYHYQHAEYYRAITDYEELALFAPDDAARAHAMIRIAVSYHRGHQLADAIAAYRAALEAVKDPDQQQALRIQLALARAERTFDEPGVEALDAVTAELAPSTTGGTYQPRALFELARIQLLRGRRGEAVVSDRALVAACLRPTPTCQLEPVLARALAAPPPAHRSAALGIVMSAVVPGAGSVYGGHLVDGIYYFGLTTLPALGAWDVHDGSHAWTDQKTTFYGLTALAAVFYAANLLSAYVSVERYNAVTDTGARRAMWTSTDQPLPLQ